MTLTLFQIFMFTAWTLAAFGFGYYFGYDRKCREIKAKEVVDNLEVVKSMENIEHTFFVGEDGKTHEIWITETKVYSMDNNFPDFEWADEFSAGTCIPVLLIPATNVSGFYKNRLVK